MKSIRFNSAAVDEMEEAADWYDLQEKRLSQLFLSDVRDTLDRIKRRPAFFPPVHGLRRKVTVRRALLRSFPYALVFRETEDTILIIATAHLRRRPQYWVDRI